MDQCRNTMSFERAQLLLVSNNTGCNADLHQNPFNSPLVTCRCVLMVCVRLQFSHDAFCSRSTCELGPVDYYPPTGFSANCFPYCGAQTSFDYISPIVMVKFRNATHGRRVAVNCRAWARNLDFSRMDKAASVRFSLVINASPAVLPSASALLITLLMGFLVMRQWKFSADDITNHMLFNFQLNKCQFIVCVRQCME